MSYFITRPIPYVSFISSQKMSIKRFDSNASFTVPEFYRPTTI